MPLSPVERKEMLALFNGLRVADVRDGMDWNMMHGYGTLDCGIRPLWRTRAIGFARTCRYLAYDRPVPPMTRDEYTEWVGWYYNNVCTYPWSADIVDGDFICIDMSNLTVGLMGSHNALSNVRKGAKGFVTNGGVRDTDEIILQKIPFWSRTVAQPMVQARIMYDSKDVPVTIGGVTIRPDDIVVADGDGVIVVPKDMAADVAKYARRELESDKKSRKSLYISMGMELDDTVQ